MAIDNFRKIDGIDIDKKNNLLCLLIADHLKWKDSKPLINEQAHLFMLSKKIDAYLDFLEQEQYKKIYPDIEFDSALIEIHFQYEITEKCKSYLKNLTEQVRNNGVIIEVHMG